MRLLSLTALLLLAAFSPAAPALAEKPPRYEYAEMKFNRNQIQEVGQPGQPQGRLISKVTIRWTTADEEIEVSGWTELADKLKTPEAKGEASALRHRLRVFKRLGEDGWEVIEHTGGDGVAYGTAAWTFKRRVP